MESKALSQSLHQAQASLPRLEADLEASWALLHSSLRECVGWNARHEHIVLALRDVVPSQLMLPEQYWIADQAPTPIGMCAAKWPCMKGVQGGHKHIYETSVYLCSSCMTWVKSIQGQKPIDSTSRKTVFWRIVASSYCFKV